MPSVLPKLLTLKEAMIYGTAGFTAALSIFKLEESGVTPEKGTSIVTGSTGGVGGMACAMLSKKGYQPRGGEKIQNLNFKPIPCVKSFLGRSSGDGTVA